MEYTHRPVMPSQVLAAVALAPGDRVIDATLGLGGHARLMLEQIGPTGRLLGIERTGEGLQEARRRLLGDRTGSSVALVRGDFRNLGSIARDAGFPSATAILFDLGLASWQIESGYQGLSFQVDRPLDMNLGSQLPSDFTRKEDDPSAWTEDAALARTVRTWRFRSAADFLGRATEDEIAIVLRALGDVGGAQTIARKLVDRRETESIETTGDLVSALGTSRPAYLAPIFQALRILASDEYGALVAGLGDAWGVLRSGGRLAVISFHSGEDRIVKHFLQSLRDATVSDPIRPSDEEIRNNPHSRSAILRRAIRNGERQAVMRKLPTRT